MKILHNLVYSIALFTIVLPAVRVSAAVYGGGSGIQTDPYQIRTPEQLNTIGINPADWDKHFKLMNNISMAAYSGTQYKIIGTSYTIPFSGSFDGQGFVISNLTYSTTAYINIVGLFGYLLGATVKDLGLENVLLSLPGEYVGGIAGINEGTIVNCYTTGSVAGNYFTGGIAGTNYSSITNSSSTCVVNCNRSAGGLAGTNEGIIDGCYATGRVNTGEYSGGLVGENYGTIANCRAEGLVRGSGGCLGGLVGNNYRGSFAGIIRNCLATGDVECTASSGKSNFGGLVGLNQEGGTIENCYAFGSVYGPMYVGGLVGKNSLSSAAKCYSAGHVSGMSSVGGFIGFDSNISLSITASFWDVQTSGTLNGVASEDPDPSGVSGRTTDQMMTQSLFSVAGWDFATDDGDDADWVMLRAGEDYPRLAWQTVYASDIAGLYGVDAADLLEIAENWLKQGCPTGCGQADINANGKVDLVDWAIFTGQWMQGL